MFLSRTLSFAGTEYELIKEVLCLLSSNAHAIRQPINESTEAGKLYNQCAELWTDLLREMKAMKAQVTGDPKLSEEQSKKLRHVMRVYWGASLRFFRQMTLALKVRRLHRCL